MDTTRARRVIDAAWSEVVQILATSGDEVLEARTRLAGWRLRDLVAHVLWGTSMETEALHHARTGDPAGAAGQDHEVSAVAAAATDLDANRRALLDAYDRLVADVEAVGDVAERTVPLAAGTFPWTLVADVLAMEAAVHADDLAHAIGAPGKLTDDGADVCFAVASWLLPAVAAGASERPDGPFVVAVVGRRTTLHLVHDPAAGWRGGPSDAAPDLVVTGDDAELVRWLYGRSGSIGHGSTATGVAADRVDAVKRWLPGP